MEYQIWLNGEYVDRDKAQIGMTDRGFRLGDVVFDTSRTFNGRGLQAERPSLEAVPFTEVRSDRPRNIPRPDGAADP